jgi:hypothetical protein
VLLCSLIALSCSSTVPPTITQALRFPPSEEPTFIISADRERVRIERSLSDAGLTVTDETSAANYGLWVRLGRSRASRRCGTKNNVSYLLFDGSNRIMVIKARGWTGSCTPSILDDMSRLLATHFPAARREIGPDLDR